MLYNSAQISSVAMYAEQKMPQTKPQHQNISNFVLNVNVAYFPGRNNRVKSSV